ncbi:MAG TPA: helix-turn-helix domain-containing protein [Gammaproteobacteria bacterium]|nr:helix-turn-helix domain-containing protein [Gammaproteobacteria bacterium]
MDGNRGSRIRVHGRDDALGRWTVAWCRPHPELAPHVATLWYGEGRVSYLRDRILPSGSSHLLINLGPAQYRIEPGPPERRIPFVDVWYSGLHQTPLDTEAPYGNALLGVALHASGGRPWLHVDAELLADRVLPLADVLGDGVLALRERLLNTPDIAARFGLVERWLAARLDGRHAVHPSVHWGLQRIERSAGALAVEALARETGLSRKHLSTLFRRQIGLTPKALARVHRFKSALGLLAEAERVPWVELAAHCGYYDQSHLIRDFHAFTGYAPGEFLRHARPDAESVVVR